MPINNPFEVEFLDEALEFIESLSPNGKQYRIFAFWDKTRKSMVLCTHGFIKKTQKVPQQEIKHAEQIMKRYYATIK